MCKYFFLFKTDFLHFFFCCIFCPFFVDYRIKYYNGESCDISPLYINSFSIFFYFIISGSYTFSQIYAFWAMISWSFSVFSSLIIHFFLCGIHIIPQLIPQLTMSLQKLCTLIIILLCFLQNCIGFFLNCNIQPFYEVFNALIQFFFIYRIKTPTAVAVMINPAAANPAITLFFIFLYLPFLWIR